MDRHPYLGVPHNSLHQGPGQAMKNMTSIRKSCDLQSRSHLTSLNCTPGSPAQPLPEAFSGRALSGTKVRETQWISCPSLSSLQLPVSGSAAGLRTQALATLWGQAHLQKPPQPPRTSLSLTSLNMSMKTSILESPREPAISLRVFANFLKFDADFCI